MLPTPRPGLATRILDGEVVIHDRANGVIHRLNSSASTIWTLCDGATTTDEIAAQIGAAFEMKPDEVLADVLRTITELRTLNLLVGDPDERDSR